MDIAEVVIQVFDTGMSFAKRNTSHFHLVCIYAEETIMGSPWAGCFFALPYETSELEWFHGQDVNSCRNECEVRAGSCRFYAFVRDIEMCAISGRCFWLMMGSDTGTVEKGRL